MPVPRSTRWLLQAIQARDRRRLRRLARRHPGLRIHPEASSNLALARFDLAEGARLEIAAGVFSERRVGGVWFSLGPGAHVEIGERTWLRSDLGPVRLFAFAGARIAVGPRSCLNGCHLSAKSEMILAAQVGVGPGARIFDSDHHDLDDAHPERREAVRVGEFAWVASDVTVLRGVEIGSHSVIGARSLVNRSIPPHTFAAGVPAKPCGEVGDRSGVPWV